MPTTLSIVVGTCNRRAQLKMCLESLIGRTRVRSDIIVVDAGSTDGTLEYVRGITGVTLVEDGARLGQAVSLNKVFRTLTTDYACWLSDDNVAVQGVLDEALTTLESDSRIGMIGLKVKDVDGPFVEAPYIGGIWPSGILNVNQGMLPVSVLREVGYFDEEFMDYGIDADLTTKILMSGYKIAYTKRVALLHYRNHDSHPGAIATEQRQAKNEKAARLYRAKNSQLMSFNSRFEHLLSRLLSRIGYEMRRFEQKRIQKGLPPISIAGYNSRDITNVLNCRYISKLDLLSNMHKNYYLVQQMPWNVISRLSGKSKNSDAIQIPAVWKDLVRKEREIWHRYRTAADGVQVIVAPSHGLHSAIQATESLLAVALTLRKARVKVLLCDEFLPGCLMSHINSVPTKEFLELGPSSLCPNCFAPAFRAYETLGLPVLRYSEYVTASESAQACNLARALPAEEIPEYTLDGLALGEHAMAGALRYFARGTLDLEPQGENVLRRFFQASLLTTHCMKNIIKKHGPSSAVFNHGIYVPQGLIGECCRENKVGVVNWNPSYRKRTFIFSHGDTYHHTLLTEPVSNWEDMDWNETCESRIMNYLDSRKKGSQDWIWFHENPEERIENIVSELGVDRRLPIIVMLTNVMWDAQLHYRANAFSNMLEWTVKTIEYFSKRRDLQLVIRIHPAEIRGTLPSRQPLMDEIQKAYPHLPSNIHVIAPESRVSTYAVIDLADSVLIYGTKTGVEITSQGIPVIVAGEAWIRNKGLTMDASSPEEYFVFLDALPLKQGLSQKVTQRARKYAFHFFFRRMIPIECMEPDKANLFELKLESFTDLLPGKNPGVDAICDGILSGSDFIFPAEKFGI